MARWAYVTAPIGAILVLGAWWAADALLAAPAPELGRVIVVTPRATPLPSIPTAPPTPPAPDSAATVPAAPPQDAGDDEDGEEDDVDDDTE